MSYDPSDTIVAVASSNEGAARGVVRLSGPAAVPFAAQIFSGDRPLGSIDSPQVVSGVALGVVDGRSAPCEAWVWPGERSYTRQPTVEFHTIGAPPLLEGLVRRLCEVGARVAKPGEFTLRAFLAGRLDLTQAEAVLGVIDAADGHQLATALAQLAGGLSGPLHAMRGALLDLLAHIEATLDFADEEIDRIQPESLAADLGSIRRDAQALLDRMQSRTETASLPRVVISGWPNVGKSSLFNALLGRHAALVASTPGATRDYLSARVTFDQRSIEMIDTAGVEPIAAGGISVSAQTAASIQRQQADLIVFCVDQTRELNAWEREEMSRLEGPSRIVAITKSDGPDRLAWTGDAVHTSAATGAAIELLKQRIVEALARPSADDGSVVASTAARCRSSLTQCVECLDSAISCARSGAEEIVAAEIRIALDHLGELVGAVYTDDILDRIFSRFCIGK